MDEGRQITPAFLFERNRLMKELREANDLLESLTRAGNFVDDLGGETDFVLDSITQLEEQINKTDDKLETLINTADTSRLKTCLTLHYKRGMIWEDVARCTGGTGDSVRTYVYRFFQTLRDKGVNID